MWDWDFKQRPTECHLSSNPLMAAIRRHSPCFSTYDRTETSAPSANDASTLKWARAPFLSLTVGYRKWIPTVAPAGGWVGYCSNFGCAIERIFGIHLRLTRSGTATRASLHQDILGCLRPM